MKKSSFNAIRKEKTLEITLDASVQRLGVLSDLHSNLSALKNVLNNEEAVDLWVCAGDLVNYFTEPNEVCALIREKQIPTVVGNHDLYVLGLLESSPAMEQKYKLNWTRNELTAENLHWLSTLPETIKITLPENREIKKICLRHASLNDMETYLYPDTAIADIFLQAGELLVLGHTHHPMLRQAGDGRVLNPGSVGQPRDSLSGASYATVDLISGECIFKRC